MAEILTEKNAGRTKTNVMHKCNLNFKQIEAYTKILLEKKLLAKQIDDNGQVIFVVTQRGKGFIKKFHRLQSQIQQCDFDCSLQAGECFWNKKRRKLNISEEEDEQLRRQLKLLTLKEMEHESRMRKEALLLSKKRKDYTKNWII